MPLTTPSFIVNPLVKNKLTHEKEVYQAFRSRFKKDPYDVSSLMKMTPEELTLLNRVFGSPARSLMIEGEDMTGLYVTHLTSWRQFNPCLTRSSRSGVYDKLRTEDWIVGTSGVQFEERMDAELVCLETIISSLMLYMLGGFSFPKDERRAKLQPLLKVDVRELLKKPRLIFLLSQMSPGFILQYCFWKTSSVLDGLFRCVKDQSKVKYACDILAEDLELNRD